MVEDSCERLFLLNFNGLRFFDILTFSGSLDLSQCGITDSSKYTGVFEK